MTLAQLKKGEKAVVEDLNTDLVPLKLIEMGCLPGNQIELLQLAPFKDPLFLNVNGAQVAIRKETAEHIQVKRTVECCLLYTSPSPRDRQKSRMPSSA